MDAQQRLEEARQLVEVRTVEAEVTAAKDAYRAEQTPANKARMKAAKRAMFDAHNEQRKDRTHTTIIAGSSEGGDDEQGE